MGKPKTIIQEAAERAGVKTTAELLKEITGARPLTGIPHNAFTGFSTVAKQILDQAIKNAEQAKNPTPPSESLNKKVVGEKRRTTIRKWKRGRKEFALYVRECVKKHPNKYKDTKDATFKLFKQYKFPFRWSKLKCYEYVKKTPT